MVGMELWGGLARDMTTLTARLSLRADLLYSELASLQGSLGHVSDGGRNTSFGRSR